MHMAPPDDTRRRFALADGIRSLAAVVPGEVTEAFLERHPDWLTRFGERARTAGLEDARYHVLFLAAAVEADTPAAYADYVRWTAGVLAARGIAPAFLDENVAQVHDAIRVRLGDQPLVDACVGAARQALEGDGGTGGVAADPGRDGGGAAAVTQRMYVQALLAGERRAALNVALEALRAGMPLLDLYADVLQAAQYEIGRLWEANRISVADEHAATAVTQFVMAQLFDRIGAGSGARGRLVMTGVEGEYHQIGALMVSDMLEACGWNVRFLGTNLPARSIVHAVGEHEADCLGVSVTMAFNIATARRLVQEARAELGAALRVVIGGAALRHTGALWQELGADAYAPDVRSAIALLCPE